MSTNGTKLRDRDRRHDDVDDDADDDDDDDDDAADDDDARESDRGSRRYVQATTMGSTRVDERRSIINHQSDSRVYSDDHDRARVSNSR